MGASRPNLLLDACVAINLRASGIWSEVLDASSRRAAMPGLAVDEVLYVLDSDGERELVPLRDLSSEGLFEVLDLRDHESELMVTLAADLGRGEAACLALAAGRKVALATDDRLARRRARELRPDIELVGTAQLLQVWANQNDIGTNGAREILQRVEVRARYRPARSDSGGAWWLGVSGP